MNLLLIANKERNTISIIDKLAKLISSYISKFNLLTSSLNHTPSDLIMKAPLYGETYLAEQFCQIPHYLAEQFHQIALYLAEHLIQKNNILFNEQFLTLWMQEC